MGCEDHERKDSCQVQRSVLKLLRAAFGTILATGQL
jgi:hypothetical protein